MAAEQRRRGDGQQRRDRRRNSGGGDDNNNGGGAVTTVGSDAANGGDGVARLRRRRGEQRDGVVGLIGGANRRMSTTRWRLYAGKPGERKWGLPLKGSWVYGNQVKGSGAPTERILGGSTYSLV
ncbi:hypothetical protein Scep_025880 [Stephania cephalantha]|uniref:Uncharacterized protein n=1 Tax=Stephania cephalantha TaxID=152367 RepID=A0AAP0HRZ4_9MAGN